VSVAGFIAAQRTDHDVPHALACRALGVAESWFYKWRDRPATGRDRRRAELDAAVRGSFDESGGTYGSPRVLDDLREAGWRVSKKTVEASMVRQGLVGRPKKRRKNLTRPDRRAVPFPDHLRRDFTAPAPDIRWVGDMTEIPTGEGKLYLATVVDLFSRRLPGFAMSTHPDAELACAAINTAVAVRGGHVAGVIFHSDRGSTYTAERFTSLCSRLGIVQSMGRVGSCFDNAAAESFFSTLEHELLSRTSFETRAEARAAVAEFIDRYNTRRRHSAAGRKPPTIYETEHLSASEHTREQLGSDQAA
jgi:transposase InsO family protein